MDRSCIVLAILTMASAAAGQGIVGTDGGWPEGNVDDGAPWAPKAVRLPRARSGGGTR